VGEKKTLLIETEPAVYKKAKRSVKGWSRKKMQQNCPSDGLAHSKRPKGSRHKKGCEACHRGENSHGGHADRAETVSMRKKARKDLLEIGPRESPTGALKMPSAGKKRAGS